MSKQYGLKIPGKSTKAPVANFTKPSIFGNDSDSDDGRPTKSALLGPGDTQKRQARIIQEKALEEDPTIFQYDELYDEIETKRQEAKKSKSTEEKKPKYIKKLLETAEKRKKEYERRVERQVQKEREEEGEMFKDKESFVTSAYKKKLEEMRKAEEEEKREAYLEAIGDVTKQKDLDGFYRHLYEQRLGTDVAKDDNKMNSIMDDKNSKVLITDNKKEKTVISLPKDQIRKERIYRKRKSSADDNENEESDNEELSAKKAHLQSNIDADSDFSIDSSDSDEDDGESNGENETTKDSNKSKELSELSENQIVIKTEPRDEKTKIVSEFKVPEVKVGTKTEEKKENAITKDEELEKVKDEVPKVKIEIWKKRTVGAVFDAAVQRYYERKAARQAA